MRSIRLSLLVYFLGLLGLALAAVSFLVYRTTQQRLAEHKDEAEKLIRAQSEERCITERGRLDAELNNEAHILAREAQGRIEARVASQMTLQGFWFEERHRNPDLVWFEERHRIPPSRSHVPTPLAFYEGVLTALNPMGSHVVNPFWMAETGVGAGPGPWAAAWHDGYRPAIRLDGGELPLQLTLADYVQIDSTWNRSYRSESLRNHPFPFDRESFAADPVYEVKFDEIELEPGKTVRRVTLKAPFAQLGGWAGRGRFPGPPPQTPPSPSGPSPRGGSARAEPPSKPAILIQCGYDTDRLARLTEGFEEDRKAEVDRVEKQNQTTLAELRGHLLITSLATFAAVVLGVYFLVWLGLLPLQRLGDAVSKVSEKDFRLQFDDARLPSELAPIVDRLKHTLNELRLAFEREKQAAADISHELRTPVAALLTTIEVTLKKPRKPEEYREVLSECHESGQQINQLVERLLMLARIDAGVDRLRVEKVDVAALAEQCTALVRPLAEARGLKLRLHSEGEAVLAADPGKLREVLTNLLHNAIEYNRPDGSIDLTVARDNGTLRVEVRDTGVGIAPEAQLRIFERFYRADPSRYAEGPHAGLGLAIVKGYVDLMGGSIDVESAVGQGSTFRVELPAA